jgi:hypothetical protein
MGDIDSIKILVEKGENSEALSALISLVQHDHNNLDAWILLSELIEDPQKKRDCYNQILRISPNNTVAWFGLKKLNAKSNEDNGYSPRIKEILQGTYTKTSSQEEQASLSNRIKSLSNSSQGDFSHQEIRHSSSNKEFSQELKNNSDQNYQPQEKSNQRVTMTTGAKKSSGACVWVVLVVIGLAIIGIIGRGCESSGPNPGLSCKSLDNLYAKAYARGDDNLAAQYAREYIQKGCLDEP